MNITVTYSNVSAWLASLDETTRQEIELFAAGAKRYDPDAPRRSTFAFAGRHEVRLAEVGCPFCGGTLVANAVTVDSDCTRLICHQCHHDILVVGLPEEAVP
jgi:hypothetical protein